MNQFPHGYCVNLDRRPDRWARASAEFERLGMSVTRIPGVDGQTEVSKAEAERFGARWYGRRPKKSYWRHQLALNRSWARAVRQAMQDERPMAAFFEDDVVFVPEFWHRWTQLQPELPSDWQILLLGWDDGPYDSEHLDVGLYLLAPAEVRCAHAWILRSSLYRTVLHELEHTPVQWDVRWNVLWQEFGVAGYCVREPLAYQLADYSDIAEEYRDGRSVNPPWEQPAEVGLHRSVVKE